MENDVDYGDLLQELRDRFDGVARLFADLASPEGAKRLVDALVSDNGESFHILIDPFDLPGVPALGKCLWVRELIERSIATPKLVEVCNLRDDLTPSERMLYLRIARIHGAAIPLTNAERAITVLGDGEGLPPGPFLDELRANGLVTCTLRVKYDVVTTLGVGAPERICV